MHLLASGNLFKNAASSVVVPFWSSLMIWKLSGCPWSRAMSYQPLENTS